MNSDDFIEYYFIMKEKGFKETRTNWGVYLEGLNGSIVLGPFEDSEELIKESINKGYLPDIRKEEK